MNKMVFLLVFCLVSGNGLLANIYYFSTSIGDDRRTAEQARKISTPWRSIEKLNAIMPILEPGDSVLFLRGDVFVGAITVLESGTASKPIVFAAYGDKNKPDPEINGRVTLTNWAKYTGSIWVTDGALLSDSVNYFTINGKAYSMGRYPNADETADGYLHIENADSCLSITDDELKEYPDWTGAELVMKPKRWLINRNHISKHEGHTIWYNSYTSYVPIKNFGYFIQNHLKTLDRFGEWYYDAVSKKMYVFFGDRLPNNFSIQASRYNVLFNIANQSHINVSGISFIGANENAVSITNSESVVVENCTVRYSGLNGIFGVDVSDLVLENNKVEDVNNTGLYFMRNCNNAIIRSNSIRRCGIIDGMGPSGNSKTEGIAVGGNNNFIEYNVIDSIGYVGLYFSGNDILIRNNVISNFTMNKDDGGGIYVVSGKKPGRTFRNRRIIGNIVTNGIGNGAGTPQPEFRSALGIYMDDGTNNVDILDNIVSNCAELGIFLHDASFIKVKNNLAYNCDIPFAMHQDVIWEGGSMHDNEIENNIFVSSMKRPLLGSYRTQENSVGNFGRLNHNYFWYPSLKPGAKDKPFKEVVERSTVLKYDIKEWQQKYNYEQDSEFHEIEAEDFDKKVRIICNDTKAIMKVSLGKTIYTSIGGEKYTGSVELQPFSWLYLLKSDVQ